MPPVGVDRQQHAGLLVALANGGHPIGLVALAVGGIHLAAGEHVHATGEHGVVGAAQHEHLRARVVSRSSITVAAGLMGSSTGSVIAANRTGAAARPAQRNR
jgi:hypothetical protein